MTEQDFELLSQYLDDELAAPQAQALRKRLMAEPELRAALTRMQTVDNEVRSTFDVPGADAVPASVSRMLEQAPVADLGLSQQRRAGWGLAIAASLLAATGLLLAPQWQQQADTQGAVLADILENSPSRAEGWDALADGSHARALLSFSNNDGQWCREYLQAGQDNTWHGVACRSDGQWITQVRVSGSAAGSSNEYRPAAAAGNPEPVAAFISSHSAAIPLSPKEESSLIAGGWQ